MATTASLREHLIDELHDLFDAEQQLIDALPEMADLATNRQLKSGFRSHLAQTKEHQRRVGRALEALGERASGKTCEAMKGLVAEGQELMSNGERGGLLDAMMITAAQKVEHYEIAAYGTVRTYAQILGERSVSRLLSQTLKEEKTADRNLTAIAEGSVNARAAREWHERSTTKALLDRSAAWLGSAVGGAMKKLLPKSEAADRRPKGRSSRKK